jgi:hypothetical protein
MIVWTKQPGNALKGVRGPFVAHVTPKGDGRWNWQIFADDAQNPLAAGVSVSAGAAKTKCDQFIQRSGRV